MQFNDLAFLLDITKLVIKIEKSKNPQVTLEEAQNNFLCGEEDSPLKNSPLFNLVFKIAWELESKQNDEVPVV